MRFQDMTEGLSDAFLLLYQSELQHFWLKSNQALEQAKTDFFHQVLTELTHVVKFGQKYEYVHQNTGHDYSTYAEPSPERYQIEDYALLGDFLAEPSGETRRTYESGMGMHALSWEETLHERWDTVTSELLFQDQPESWEDCLELIDFLCLWQLELNKAMMNQLKDVPFYWMIQAYGSAAEALQNAHAEQAVLHSRLAQARAQIAAEVHPLARQLLPRETYTMAEKALFMDGLSQLSQQVSDLEFQIYLHSVAFAQICSLKLAQQAQRHFHSPP